MNSNILEVKNLSLELDNEQIINNLSFDVQKGEFLTILGPNGSGKTILLRALLNLISKYKGEINWAKNTKIGYLPQGLTHLKFKNIPLSVQEFFLLKEKNKQKHKEYLNLVGLYDSKILQKQLGNLSGGQFQRILMIWALFDNPDILLFDEPTVGIDIHGEQTVYNLLHKFQKERNLSIILITHDFNVVYKYSTNVLCMSRDNICHAKPEEVLSPEKLEKIYGMPIKFYKHNH